MPEIQRADPVARRRALIGAGIVAVLGWAAYFALQEWLAHIRGADPERVRAALEDALIWGSWAASLPVAAFAAWLWRLGARVARAERFPPPGARVIRDTQVLHGEQARLRALLFRVLAAFLGLLSAGTVLAAYRLVARLHA